MTTNNSELNITHLFADDSAFSPFDCSNNRATLGDNAGQLTWQASVETAQAIVPPLLDTDEKRQEFRDYVKDFGAWTEEEIAAWNDTELNALLLQFIAADVREAFHDAEFSEWDWADYQERAERGSISGHIYRGDDGQVYFYIGN